MYRPTSKASDRPGTIPPRVAALTSSSVASQAFIFSSKDFLEDETTWSSLDDSPSFAARSVVQCGMRWVDADAMVRSPRCCGTTTKPEHAENQKTRIKQRGRTIVMCQGLCAGSARYGMIWYGVGGMYGSTTIWYHTDMDQKASKKGKKQRLSTQSLVGLVLSCLGLAFKIQSATTREENRNGSSFSSSVWPTSQPIETATSVNLPPALTFTCQLALGRLHSYRLHCHHHHHHHHQHEEDCCHCFGVPVCSVRLGLCDSLLPLDLVDGPLRQAQGFH